MKLFNQSQLLPANTNEDWTTSQKTLMFKGVDAFCGNISLFDVPTFWLYQNLDQWLPRVQIGHCAACWCSRHNELRCARLSELRAGAYTKAISTACDIYIYIMYIDR